jgi:hypothetical protein
MAKRLAFVFVCLLLLAGCAGPTTTVDVGAEENAVYAALIGQRYVGDDIKLIVIEEQTSPFIQPDELESTLKRVKESLPGLSNATIEDFRAMNQESHAVGADLELGVKYVLISQAEVKEIFQDSTGWDVFYARYPGSQGVMTLSRVGFNKAMDQALVYAGNQSHWLAGAGYFYLLSKKDGVWVIQADTMVWIS